MKIKMKIRGFAAKIACAGVVMAFGQGVYAQTTATLFSQQMQNKANFNPAAVMQKPLLDISLFGRMQWVGFEGAPRAVMLNASGYLPEARSGISGSVMGEAFGSVFTLNAKLGYSYHVHLGRMNYLSFGLNAGIIYKNLMHDRVTMNPDDPALRNEKNNDVKPDVDFGIVLTLRDFQLGLSATHLTAWAYDRKNDYYAPKEGYYAYIQYTGNISPKFGMDPYICAYYGNETLKVEGALNFRILDLFWVGGGYRYNDAAFVTAGLKLGKTFYLGYSYDFGMGGLRKQHSGSHEIYLSLRFETTRKPAETSDTPLFFE